MTDTPPDPAAIQSEYARRRRLYGLLMIPLVLMIFAFIALDQSADHTLMGIPPLVVIALDLVVLVVVGWYIWRIWRCPACEKRLPPTNPMWKMKQCVHCGARLSG
jgi:hypothetical protein